MTLQVSACLQSHASLCSSMGINVKQKNTQLGDAPLKYHEFWCWWLVISGPCLWSEEDSTKAQERAENESAGWDLSAHWMYNTHTWAEYFFSLDGLQKPSGINILINLNNTSEIFTHLRKLCSYRKFSALGRFCLPLWFYEFLCA